MEDSEIEETGEMELLINENFLNYLNYRTTSSNNILNRLKLWEDILEKILIDSQKQVRCFSYKLKEELYENNSICAICGNKIIDIDDAAVDHIEQYWLGGKTIPDNARLTHRFCNNSRPRIENSILLIHE